MIWSFDRPAGFSLCESGFAEIPLELRGEMPAPTMPPCGPLCRVESVLELMIVSFELVMFPTLILNFLLWEFFVVCEWYWAPGNWLDPWCWKSALFYC